MQYKEKISHSTDAKDSIQWRSEFMLRDFLLANPNLCLKDERPFVHTSAAPSDLPTRRRGLSAADPLPITRSLGVKVVRPP